VSVLTRLRGWMGVWIVVLATVVATLPAPAQGQAGNPDLGDSRSPVRMTSSGNSLAAAMDGSTNWVSSDLITKILLFVVFNVCVGVAIGVFKGRLRMAFVLSLLLGPIGWVLIIVFVKPPPEFEDPGHGVV
jgi:hypothetical protein